MNIQADSIKEYDVTICLNNSIILMFSLWQLVALLVYADSGSPVEKPKDDAEAPLLTTFDGVEFPSTERPIKLIHGRASFKLKISQVLIKLVFLSFSEISCFRMLVWVTSHPPGFLMW